MTREQVLQALEEVLQVASWRVMRPADEPLRHLDLIAESERRVVAARVSTLAQLQKDYQESEAIVAFHLIPQLNRDKAWEVYLLLVVMDLSRLREHLDDNWRNLKTLLHDIVHDTRYCRKLVLEPDRETLRSALEPLLPLSPPPGGGTAAVREALRDALAQAGNLEPAAAADIICIALEDDDDERALARILATLETASGGER